MKPLTKSKRLLSLLLAAVVALPVFGVNSVQAAEPVTLSATSPVSHYDNYFQDVYPSLNGVTSHVFKTVTYEDLVTILGSKGTFAILIGGAWSDETNADIGYINEVAKANNIQTIYNFDTRLDGVSAGLDLAVTHPPLTTTSVSGSNTTTNYFDYTEYYVELVNKYLTNLTTLSSTPASYQNKSKRVVNTTTGTETTASTLVASGTAKAVQSPYLLIYNKDYKVNGVSAPVVSYLEKHGAGNAESYTWDSYFKNNPTNVTNYKAQVQSVFDQASSAGYAPASFGTLTSWDFIGPAFNKNRSSGTIEIFPSKTVDEKAVPDLGTDGIYEPDSNLVFEHVTYHELTKLLTQPGNFAFLFGGSWCPNTQAEIRWINRYAKAHNIDKIYFFDTRLDAGVGVTIRTITPPPTKPLNPHDDGTTLQTRDNETANPLAYLYGSLVNDKFTNIITTYTLASGIKYTANGAGGTAISAFKLQVPYLFTYNKDNKDANGASAPILGHVEVMNTWANTYKGPFYKSVYGDASPQAQYDKYDIAANDLFSRLESTPDNLVGVAPTASDATNGQITGVAGRKLEYTTLNGTSYTAVTGDSITGLAPGTYQVRYSQSKGYNTSYNPTATSGTGLPVTYAANSFITVVVPQFQDAPTGLTGVAPTSPSNDDGQIRSNSVLTNLEYKLAGDSAYTAAESIPITGLAAGTYLVRNAAKSGFNASEPTAVVVPAYVNQNQDAPEGLIGVAPTSSDNNDGKINGTTSLLEYKLSSATSYSAITGTSITGLAAGTYDVRVAAKSGFNASEPTQITVPEYNEQSQDAPEGLTGVAPTSPANDDGKINGTTSLLEFKLTSATSYTSVTGTSITGLSSGTYHVRVAAKPGFSASSATVVVVPAFVNQDQAAPSGLAASAPTSPTNHDGQITSTSVLSNLEYKLASDTAYLAAESTPITGLAPGTYLVRFAAQSGINASEAISVTVPAYVGQNQASPSGLTGVAPTSKANNDGKITATSVLTNLEYKLASDTEYITAASTPIFGLAAGTYHIRFAAKPGYDASPDVTVIVPVYTAPPVGGGSGGGTITPTTPVDNSGIVTTPGIGNSETVTVSAPSKTDASTGDTLATLSQETVTGIVNNVKKTETSGKSSVVEVKVETTEQTKTAQLSVPKTAFNDIATGTKADVRINYGNVGTISFDSKAIETINASTVTGDVSIIIAKSELTPEGKEVLGDRPVYDFSVFVGQERVSSFGGGNANISIPYVLKAGESPEAVIIYYVTDDGELETIRGQYNAATGTVDFGTKHFSQYIIGYNKVSFEDVSGSSWYGKAVSYLAARDITGGTDDTHFSPDAALTRGQFIVLLLKAYGIQPADNGADNFVDVVGNKYYTNYLAAAKKLGIATGIGDNQFAPDKAITRQELFTLLYRSLGLLGELPSEKSGATVATFADASQIADYAQSAVSAFVESGVITGSNGKLDPQGVTTRAQVAQVLYNLLSK